VNEKHESLQGYSTNLKFSRREKQITAGILNKFKIQWTRKTNHCRTSQPIYNSVNEKNESLQGYSTNLKFSTREKQTTAGLLNKVITP
jgi:hypothetical protein